MGRIKTGDRRFPRGQSTSQAMKLDKICSEFLVYLVVTSESFPCMTPHVSVAISLFFTIRIYLCGAAHIKLSTRPSLCLKLVDLVTDSIITSIYL